VCWTECGSLVLSFLRNFLTPDFVSFLFPGFSFLVESLRSPPLPFCFLPLVRSLSLGPSDHFAIATYFLLLDVFITPPHLWSNICRSVHVSPEMRNLAHSPYFTSLCAIDGFVCGLFCTFLVPHFSMSFFFGPLFSLLMCQFFPAAALSSSF